MAANEQIENGTVIGPGGAVSGTDRALEVILDGGRSTPLPVTISGTTTGGTSAVTRVPVSVTNVTLKAANVNRISLTLFNNSATATMFFKYGAVASIVAGAESWTVEVPPGKGYFINDWNGIVDAIWDIADAAGECLVTEVTA